MHTHRAFTLIEILVALAVFAIIGVLSSRILLGMVDVSSATADHAATLAELQRAVSVVERDVQQLVRRSVRDEHGDPRDAVAVNDEALLELTRRGWQNPLGAPRAELQRVAYVLRDEKLIRLFWPILDRAGRYRTDRAAIARRCGRLGLPRPRRQGQRPSPVAAAALRQKRGRLPRRHRNAAQAQDVRAASSG